MSITITAEQRDALYEQILVRLSGIDGIWLAVSAEDHKTAERLGREYSDDLRLVLDDLGWGGHRPDVGDVELTTPPDVLHRILPRLHDSAASQEALEERGRTEEVRTQGVQNQLVMDTCRTVLTALDDESAGQR